MQFKKRKVWLGALECQVSEEDENILRAMRPVSTKNIDGVLFIKYPDGHIEVKKQFEILKEMAREISGKV